MACLSKELKQSTDNITSIKQKKFAHYAFNKPEKHYVVETSSKPSNNELESVLLIKYLSVVVTAFSLVLLVLSFANVVLSDGSLDRRTNTLLLNFQLLGFAVNIIAGVFRNLLEIDFKKRRKVIVTVFSLLLLVLSITDVILSDRALDRGTNTVFINLQLLGIAAYILAGIFEKLWDNDLNKKRKVILLLACYSIRLIITSVETLIESYLSFKDQCFYDGLCLIEVLWTMLVLSTANVCLLAMIIYRFLRLFIREFYNKNVVEQV